MNNRKRPKVSVIVAVYNVEQYVERCAHSLFNQTLDSMEYIFVDDCTPDNSIELIKKVLESYPQREAQVKFIHHKTNQGQAAARTTGMKAATGEYIIHCDPDDWVDLDTYELMYRAAHPEGRKPIDVVLCNYMLHEKGGEKKGHIREFELPQDYIRYVYEKHASIFFLPCRTGRLSDRLTLARIVSGDAVSKMILPEFRISSTFSSRVGTPPPQETTTSSRSAIFRRRSVSFCRNAPSPSLSNISGIVIPYSDSISRSISTRGIPYCRIRYAATALFPLPINPIR